MPTSGLSLYDRAIADPQSVFKQPSAVIGEDKLSKQQKIKVLGQWEQDARLIQVAEEESMTGGEKSMLREVRMALQEIRGCAEEKPGTPTKSGIPSEG